MKYSVLVALLGTSQARHHNHHRLAQLNTPDESRAAWDSTRNTSWAVVAEQQRFQAEHNAMVAKNFDDDTAATDAQKNHVRKGYVKTLSGANSFVQTNEAGDPLGESNGTFVPSKASAAATIAKQEAFEAAKTADVASRNAANTNAADTLKHHVTLARDIQAQGGDRNENVYPTRSQWTGRQGWEAVNVQTNSEDPLGKANETFVPSKAAAAATVATQQATEAANTASVESKYSADGAAAKSHENHVSAARDLQAAGDVLHERFPWVQYQNVQVEDNEADPAFLAGKAAAAAVVAKQVDFEAKKTADVATRNDKDSKECLDLRTHVVTTHETRLKSFDPNVQMVYIPEQEIYLGLY